MIPTLPPTSTAAPTQLPTTLERSTSTRLPNTTSTVATNNEITTKIRPTKVNDVQTTTKPTGEEIVWKLRASKYK